jgi:hypothetical protein
MLYPHGKQGKDKGGRGFIMEYGLLVSKSADFLQPFFNLVHSIPYGKAIVAALVFFFLIYFFILRSR